MTVGAMMDQMTVAEFAVWLAEFRVRKSEEDRHRRGFGKGR